MGMLLDLPLSQAQVRFLRSALENLAEVPDAKAAIELRLVERLANRVNGNSIEESHRAIIEHHAVLNFINELFAEADSTREPIGGQDVYQEQQLTEDYIHSLNTYVGTSE